MHPADIIEEVLLNRLTHKDKILNSATADKLETKEGRNPLYKRQMGKETPSLSRICLDQRSQLLCTHHVSGMQSHCRAEPGTGTARGNHQKLLHLQKGKLPVTADGSAHQKKTSGASGLNHEKVELVIFVFKKN